MHLASVYSGLNFIELGELNYVDYLILRRDAFIFTCTQSEKGEEYLNNAWRFEQTKPDRDALRARFKREG